MLQESFDLLDYVEPLRADDPVARYHNI